MGSVKQIVSNSEYLITKAKEISNGILPYIAAGLLQNDIIALQELDSAVDYSSEKVIEQKIICEIRYIQLEYSLCSFFKECSERYRQRSIVANMKKSYDEAMLSISLNEISSSSTVEFFSKYKDISELLSESKSCTFRELNQKELSEYERVLNDIKIKQKR